MSRALSGFGEAYRRAAYRTNTSGSPCPFKRFPYLLSVNASSLDERLSRALDVLQKHGRLGLGVARVRIRCRVRCIARCASSLHTSPSPSPSSNIPQRDGQPGVRLRVPPHAHADLLPVGWAAQGHLRHRGGPAMPRISLQPTSSPDPNPKPKPDPGRPATARDQGAPPREPKGGLRALLHPPRVTRPIARITRPITWPIARPITRPITWPGG